jgi:hypothetical protein
MSTQGRGKHTLVSLMLVWAVGVLCTALAGCGPNSSGSRVRGFAADFAAYNLFHFPVNYDENQDMVRDASDQGNDGQIIGQVTRGSGKFQEGLHFGGGYVRVDVEEMPEALAFDGWVRLDQLQGEAVLASQERNFRLRAFWIMDPDRHPPEGIGLSLDVYDSTSGRYRMVADTYYDERLDLELGRWHHIVALYDGHVKGRIYVDDQVNAEGIWRFEINLNRPYDHTDSPDWPRVSSDRLTPVVLGATVEGDTIRHPLHGVMDEVRFSDISRFRVNNGTECPPNCRPGDHGVTGPYHNWFHHPCASHPYYKQHPPTDTYYQQDHQYWRWAPERMHEVIPFSYRMPYIQNVTDHSAVIVWRRQCDLAGLSVDSYNPEEGCVHEAMQFCFGEAGGRMPECEFVYPEGIDVARDNYPDCQYMVKLEDLRPSTWYHYKVSEMKGEFDSAGSCVGKPRDINLWVEPLTDSEGNEIEWRFKDCWPTGWVRHELASDAHFRTAPLAVEDQVEFLAFGDMGPLVCAPALLAAGKLRACYWLEKQRDIDTRIWGKDVPIEAYKYTMEYDEAPSLWLSPGDLAQTKYNDHVFEAYLFGMFNKVWWYSWDRPAGFYNGMMEGVPLYAAIGNHEWEADDYGTDQCKRRADEYVDNLFPPKRRFEGLLNDEFAYDTSSYSFDYGNMHIVSLCVSCDNSCEHWVLGSNYETEPCRTDQACYIAEWDQSDPADAWAERLPGSHEWNFDSLQIAWLKRDLWNYKDDHRIWKIVMFHVPLYGEEVGQSPFMMTEDRLRLARLFELADVDLILVGHRHHYHRSTTGPITEKLAGAIPDEEHAIHLVVGTGGYVADADAGGATVIPWFVDDHIPDHVGVPKLWVDGNALFLRWYSLKQDYDTPAPLEESCLFLKNVDDVNKSDCLVPGNFPVAPCAGKSEGDSCSFHSSAWSREVSGRCIIPHTRDPEVTGGNGSWGPDLRCIPLPSEDGP